MTLEAGGQYPPRDADAAGGDERGYNQAVAGADGGLPGTGLPDVDAALAALSGVDSVPPKEQVARFEHAHQALHRVLRTIDET